MANADLLRAQADRIRASGVLGRSSLMQRLFDFLLERSLADRAPKEIEVAVDAFGKGADFDVSQDAMVRVYVHKLRRKLEEFYDGPGATEAVHLSIPKGEYRFVIEREPAPPGIAPDAANGAASTTATQPPTPRHTPAQGLAPPPAHASEPSRPARASRWLLIALAASLLVNGVILLTAYIRPGAPRDELATVRASALWSPILADDRNIVVVVGDYYIFGETDDTMEVRRLVREFDINSSQDLEQYLKVHPEQAERYLDLELAYLPTAAAYALRDLMPVLSAANRRVRVVTMSQLNPAVLKSSDVIYLGYLSGLGPLRELIFRSSRLKVGDSYDELVDRSTGTRYVSQAAVPYRGDDRIHDYGYFATFPGPNGNRIVVIAGMRDVAAMHMAEAVTSPRRLAALLSQAHAAPGFEALYEVYGLDRLNLDGKLLLAAPLDAERIWTDARDADK